MADTTPPTTTATDNTTASEHPATPTPSASTPAEPQPQQQQPTTTQQPTQPPTTDAPAPSTSSSSSSSSSTTSETPTANAAHDAPSTTTDTAAISAESAPSPTANAPAPATATPSTSTASVTTPTAPTTSSVSTPPTAAKSGGHNQRKNPPRSRSTSRTAGSDNKNVKPQTSRSRSSSINRAAISPRDPGPGKICDGVVKAESHALQTPWTWWFSRKAKRGRVNSFTSGPNAAPPGGAGFIVSAFRPQDLAEEGDDDADLPPSQQQQQQQQQVRGKRGGGGSDSVDDSEHRGGLSQICTCTTVEEFWAQYSYLQRPAMLPKESNYYFFRNNAEPMWETFPKGGCFIVRIKKGVSLNLLWEELLFATIGEAFEEPNVIGVVVSIRSKEDALSVWTKVNSNSIRTRVGELLKDILSLDKNTVIAYKSHASAMRDKSTYKNAKKIFVAN
eukprot:TRINITY_DN692_c1_g1_i1.p1 TRINITY_DN692_c1_g1~~TRINITY_DN692_c1_g1_i1.p1  ORF type:complete len:446 (-),score=138.23 TRINITY_DN692_c1_g1_i1:6-1343(-)